MAYFNKLKVGNDVEFMGNVSWPGLESTTDELNVLHTEKITVPGWSLTDEGDVYTGLTRTRRDFSLKLIPNNTYRVVYTGINGETIEENLIPQEMEYEDMTVLGLRSNEMDSIILWDKVHFEKENFKIPLSGGLTWHPPFYLDNNIVDVVIYGEGEDGEFTHEVSKSNTMNKNNLPISLQKFLPMEMVEKEGFIVPDGFEFDVYLY